VQVLGIGNVTECNRSYIFLNNDGKQDRIRATPELLRLIRDTASTDQAFYDRMCKEITTAYEKRKVEVKKKYHFITDDMVKEAFLRDHKEGLSLSCLKDTNNEECTRQYGMLFGLYEGANIAMERRWEARKLLAQAEDGLKE